MKNRLILVLVAVSTFFAAGEKSIGQSRRNVAINGANLSYIETGNGEPVVFVHGGLQDYRMWVIHMPKFADRYRVIAYSRRNNFPNDVSADGTPDGAADLHGEDLATFIRALGLGKVRIVAHSSGAHAALFFAASHPDMVVSLALNEPPAVGLIAGASDNASLLKEWGEKLSRAKEVMKSNNAEVAIPLIVNAIGGPGAYERRSEADKKMNLDNLASYQADAKTKRPRVPFTCEMARSINVPVLLTNGEKSPEFFHRIADRLQACLPQCTRASIAGSSHTVPSEQPDAYDDAVIGFFARR